MKITKENIICLIIGYFRANPNKINEDTNFYTDLNCGSLDIVECVVFVKEAFGITSDCGNVIPETVGELITLIKK